MVESTQKSSQLSEDIIAKISALTDPEIVEMMAWSPSEKIKHAEVEAHMLTPAGQAEAQKEMGELFAKHANSEGLLRLAEFQAFA